MLEAFGWGAFGASSLLLGALIAVWRPPGTVVLGLVMGFGAGVLLSAASFELVEEAAETSGGSGGTTLGLFAGAIVFFIGDLVISKAGYRNRKDIGGQEQDAGQFAIVLGTVLDGVPESAVLGLTVLQTGNVAASMLVAVFVSNLPECDRGDDEPAQQRLDEPCRVVPLGGIVLVCGISAAVGYALLDGASPSTLAFMFPFAGGAILTMLSTSMMPEAYEHAGRTVGLATTLGFAVAFGINWLS